MTKLRVLITHYGPAFGHGLIAGMLAVLTLHSGLVNGCC